MKSKTSHLLLSVIFLLTLIFPTDSKGILNGPLDVIIDQTISTTVTYTSITVAAGVTLTITGNVTCTGNIDFESANGSIVIESGGVLTLNGNVVNNATATFTVRQGGSFLPATSTTYGTANIKIEKSGSASGYSFTLPMVTGVTYPDTVYIYDETDIDTDSYGSWVRPTAGNGIPFGIGLAAHSPGNFSFTGTPIASAGTLSLSLTSNDTRVVGGEERAGHHLIGNPYAAAIDIAQFFSFSTNNNTNATYGSIYLWKPSLNGGDGGYESATTGYVPSGQAFFIQIDNTLADGNHNIELDPSMRVVDNNTAFNRIASEHAEVVLNFKSGNDHSNKLTFRFSENFTSSFDKRYDAYSMSFEDTGELRVKASYNSRYFDILAIPQAETVNVPIAVRTNAEMDIEVEVVKVSGIPEGYELDLLQIGGNQTLSLTEGAKGSFSVSQMDYQSAFMLQYRSPGAVLGVGESTGLKVYTQNGILTLEDPQSVPADKSVWIYTLSGQILGSWKLAGATKSQLTLPANRSNILLVKVATDKGIYTYKTINQAY